MIKLVIISEQIYMSWKRMERINSKPKSSKLGSSIEVKLYSSKLSGDLFFKRKKDFPPTFYFLYQDMVKHSVTLGQATMSLREKISRAADIGVDIKVQNLPLQFYLSTLDGLADLFEDEIIPTPIPMKVSMYLR